MTARQPALDALDQATADLAEARAVIARVWKLCEIGVFNVREWGERGTPFSNGGVQAFRRVTAALAAPVPRGPASGHVLRDGVCLTCAPSARGEDKPPLRRWRDLARDWRARAEAADIELAETKARVEALCARMESRRSFQAGSIGPDELRAAMHGPGWPDATTEASHG